MRARYVWILLFVACVPGFVAPAKALTTTYVFDNFGIRDTCEDAATEFPELCVGGQAAALTVTFRHSEPIWDNDASGCDPDVSSENCETSSFTDLIEITFLDTIIFDPSEVTDLQHIDFLGRFPCTDCEGPGPPYIVLTAVDTETGIRLDVTDYSQVHFNLELRFPDGRFFDDCCEWTRLPTTASEPGTLACLALGLLGIGFARRRSAGRESS
jgi:hypothetical protein